jgi:hypothetical protein
MTKTELDAYIGVKLADASDITALEHREVEYAITQFIADNLPILKGTYTVGDAVGTDSVRTVSFADIGTSNYIVTGSFVSNSVNYDFDNDVFPTIKNKTSTSFQLLLREVAGVTQNLDFDYIIFKK